MAITHGMVGITLIMLAVGGLLSLPGMIIRWRRRAAEKRGLRCSRCRVERVPTEDDWNELTCPKCGEVVRRSEVDA